MVCENCNKPIPVKIKGRGRKAKRFCCRQCRDAHRNREVAEAVRAARRRAKKRARPLFEDEILKPEIRTYVAEVLAWAETQHPATPETWGIKVAREEAA